MKKTNGCGHGTSSVNRLATWPGEARGASFLALLTILGCTSAGELSGQESKQQTAELEEPEPASDAVCQERPSRTAVNVQWGGPIGPGAMKQVPVLLTNNSAVAQAVTLVLSGTSPNAQQVVEQKWFELVLAAGQKQTVQLPFDRAPVQSTVRPSGLRVVAQFAESGAAPSSGKRTVFTEPLLVTFKGDFKAATARSLGDQKKADAATPDLDAILQSAFEVRLRSEKSGAMVAVAAPGLASDAWAGAMGVRDVSAEEAEADRGGPHAPDTEIPVGDGGPGFTGETL